MVVSVEGDWSQNAVHVRPLGSRSHCWRRFSAWHQGSSCLPANICCLFSCKCWEECSDREKQSQTESEKILWKGSARQPARAPESSCFIPPRFFPPVLHPAGFSFALSTRLWRLGSALEIHAAVDKPRARWLPAEDAWMQAGVTGSLRSHDVAWC